MEKRENKEFYEEGTNLILNKDIKKKLERQDNIAIDKVSIKH